jgi:polygalacturonase
MCKDKVGTVVIPSGTFKTGGLRMWSDTELYLCSGAKLVGSDICEDYEVYSVPEGIELRTDMELITQYYENRPWDSYRRAIISVYGGKNIRFTGLGSPSSVKASEKEPLTVKLKNVKVSMRDGSFPLLFDGRDTNTKIITE